LSPPRRQLPDSSPFSTLGVIETGTRNVNDAVNEQPWLPNGPVPTTITWQRPTNQPTTTTPAPVTTTPAARPTPTMAARPHNARVSS
jgi:hypothetical protein